MNTRIDGKATKSVRGKHHGESEEKIREEGGGVPESKRDHESVEKKRKEERRAPRCRLRETWKPKGSF